jgi:mRNA interferase YafQ
MSKYDVAWTGQFKKDYKLARKRNLKIELLDEIIRKLSRGEVLSQENRDHALSENWSGYRECHVQPDWLLIYRINDDALELLAHRTGTHSDLFV